MTLLPVPAHVLRDLIPGDTLVYRSGGFFSWLVRVKSASPCSHVEVAMGHRLAYAARQEGIRGYPIRTEGLYAVLRPEGVFDAALAVEWYNTSAVGQAYGYLDLLKFFTLSGPTLTRMTCSEFATRLLRRGGLVPFDPTWDADLIAPGDFLRSPHFRELWSARED